MYFLFISYLKRETKEFFGLEDEDETDSQQRMKWENKRLRLASRKYGPLREGVLDSYYSYDRDGGHSKTGQSFSNDCHALRDVSPIFGKFLITFFT